MAYGWPGNVRQLENTVFRAIVLCEGDLLDVEDFPQIASLVEGYEIKIPPAPQLAPKPALPQRCGRHRRRLAIAAPGRPGAWATAWRFGIPVVTEGGHIRKLEEVEADMIRLALAPLPGPDVGSRPQAGHRPLDALPADEGSRPRGSG